jgi:hypothetical protein
MEAVWLAAICVVPLLLNPQSPHSGYQPFKFGFLRILALVGAGAWLVRTIELRTDVRPHLAAFVRSPLSILFSLFALAVVVSTAFSVYPGASFWGAPETFQGAVTYAAEFTLLLLVAFHLRTRDQIERFVTVLLATSLAVAVFAILQRFGWDPRYPKIPGDRVLSTAGHPIYLAGYLLMSVPLTIYRLLTLREWRAPAGLRRASGYSRMRAVAIGFYVTVLLTQLAAFFCAESRGPTLALGVTLLAFGVFYAAYHRWKRALWILGAIVLVAITSFVLAGSGLKSLRAIPGLKRFAETTALQKGVDFFRADLWKQAPSIIFAREPLPHPTGGEDRHHHLRPWIGYGSETLECVLPRYYQINDQETHVIENRFHDLVWDLWFSFGAFGLTAFIGAILLLFYHAHCRLGFVGSRTSTAIFWTMSILSGVAGVLFFTSFLGIGFAGVGLLGGLVAGFLIFAAFFGLHDATPKSFSSINVLILALLTAIAGHLIDMAFAFVTAPTAVLFWTYAGLLIALLREDRPELSGDCAALRQAKRKIDNRQRERQSAQQSAFVCGALVTLGLVALLISAVHQYRFEPFSVDDAISGSLFDTKGTGDRHSLLLTPLIAFWIAASFALALDEAVAGLAKKMGRRFVGTLIIAGVAGLGYAIWRSGQITAIGPIPRVDATDSAALEQARGYDNLFISGIAVLLVLMFLVAMALMRASRSPLRSTSKSGMLTACLAVLLAAVISWKAAIVPLRAAVSVAWAETLDETERSRLSLAVYRRALTLDPRPYLYPAMMSEVLLKKTRSTPNIADAEKDFAEAERVLLEARKVSDLNRSSFYLGRLYLIWADREKSGSTKTSLEQKAAAALRQARIFERHAEPVAKLNDIAEKIVAGHSGDEAP